MFERVSLKIFYRFGVVDIKVWVKDNELYYSRHTVEGPELDDTDSISSIKAEEFSQRLEAVKITEWDETYEDITVLDGVTWTVEYLDAGHKKYTSSGCNGYLETWERFIELLKEAVGEF